MDEGVRSALSKNSLSSRGGRGQRRCLERVGQRNRAQQHTQAGPAPTRGVQQSYLSHRLSGNQKGQGKQEEERGAQGGARDRPQATPALSSDRAPETPGPPRSLPAARCVSSEDHSQEPQRGPWQGKALGMSWPLMNRTVTRSYQPHMLFFKG